ncbi:MAG TPA: phosphoglycerate mutase family protein [Candidatus Saccharimonadales bacterium]|nr:phosphoglycerate mutase family protein [Candidatus Saccharimonadales bacterium]
MEILLIRHGSTGVKRGERAGFGPDGAPLSEQGIIEAKALAEQLAALGIDLAHEPTAVSPMLRTRQTAELAGLRNLRIEPLISEVNSGLDVQTVDAMLSRREVPEQVLAAAKMVLENPPTERIWVTHGFLIAGLCGALEQVQEPFMADCGSIRRLTI